MKITEFQRKTYKKTIDHIAAFIPDDGITGADLLTVIEFYIKSMPDNEIDALFDISGAGCIDRHKMFDRNEKEMAVGMALLSIIMKAMNDGKDQGKAGEDPGETEADDAE